MKSLEHGVCVENWLQYTDESAFNLLLLRKNVSGWLVTVSTRIASRFSEAAESPPMAMPATLPPPSPYKEVVFYEPKEYSPGLQLYWASCARSLPDMAEALAHGAEVNWVNTEDDKRTPLIMAVQGVSIATDNPVSSVLFIILRGQFESKEINAHHRLCLIYLIWI